MNQEKETIGVDDIDELDLSELYGANPNIQPVSTIEEAKSVSFEQPLVDGQKAVISKPKRRFITRNIQIDKFNIVRRRIELTPSVCDVCAFDVAVKNFGSWHQVPANERDTIVAALSRHKELVHTKADSLIIDEDQMPTKWLGGGKL